MFGSLDSDPSFLMLALDLGATFLAGTLLTIAGLKLRRYFAARSRNRRIDEPLGAEWLRRSRPTRMKQFEGMAHSVLTDVGGLVVEGVSRVPDARAMLPLVVEVKRHGQFLLGAQSSWHYLFAPSREWRLDSLVKDLGRLEELLRNLPRSELTLEDVLAGRFENLSKASPEGP